MEGFVKDNFKGCLLNTYEIPLEEDLIEKFPLLKKIKSFEYDFLDVCNSKKVALEYKNATIRFINYFYSYNAKYFREAFPDTHERKFQCARLAGFKFKDGLLVDLAKDIISCRNSSVNVMIVDFVRHNYSDRVSNFLLTRESLYSLHLKNIEDPKGVDIEKIDKISKSLESMEERLLGGDSNSVISEMFIAMSESSRLGLRPEDVAKRIAEGKPPINFEVYD